MRRPNFFIVGAPKCGTTALYTYLAEHPDVFMPTFKEPHYFSPDLRHEVNICDEGEYSDLFDAAQDRHRAIGEASVWYLFSSEAIPRIHRFAPDSRLIVMVRRPTEMFASFHNHMVATNREDVEDAEQAWRLQAQRALGQDVPRRCDQPKFLQYGEICRLGEQLERLMSVFPSGQVRVIVFDDFVRDTRASYRDTLQFLGLSDDGRMRFPAVNVARRLRWPLLGVWHQATDRQLRNHRASRTVCRALQPLRPASRLLRRINVSKSDRSKISESFENELAHYFAEDIGRLETLLKRDLSDWKRTRQERNPERSDERGGV